MGSLERVKNLPTVVRQSFGLPDGRHGVLIPASPGPQCKLGQIPPVLGLCSMPVREGVGQVLVAGTNTRLSLAVPSLVFVGLWGPLLPVVPSG